MKIAHSLLAKSIIAGLSAFILTASAFAAEIADKMTGAELAEALEEAGMDAELVEDKNSGAPVAVASVGDYNFVVRGMDCSGNPTACSQWVFFTNFNLGRMINNQDFRIVNSFNDSSIDGRAYILERTGEVGVDFYIDLSGGVTIDHISDRLSRWESVINEFVAKFNAAYTQG